jgi:hypothetical protein
VTSAAGPSRPRSRWPARRRSAAPPTWCSWRRSRDGLGGRCAGTDALDPGEVADGAPDGKLEASGHDTALWRCASADDRMAFAGEASGVWLWAVLWPPAAELVPARARRAARPAREVHAGLDLPIGAPTTRL